MGVKFLSQACSSLFPSSTGNLSKAAGKETGKE